MNIVEQGTSNGTISDVDGNYSITVAGRTSVLVFSFIGYLDEDITVGDQTVIDIGLIEDILQMDEVVVVGYGTIKKKDLTGSVAVVSSETLTRRPTPNVTKALQGNASGVMVASGGAPGSQAIIRVRGIGSINHDPDPLIVVDGVVTGMGIDNLSPDEIESINVLKDASAAAIYGARGSNGVIMITTKRGQRESINASYSGYFGWSNVRKKFDMINGDEYANLMKTNFENGDLDLLPAYTDSARSLYGNVSTNWQDDYYNPAMSQYHNLKVSGGGKNSNYFISGYYADEEGVVVDTWNKRLGFRANSDFDIGKRVKIGESLLVTQSNGRAQRGGNGNPYQIILRASPLMPVLNDTAKGGYSGPTRETTGDNDVTNPVAEQRLKSQMNYSMHVTGNIYADIKILEGLHYRITLGSTIYQRRERFWNPTYELGTIGGRSNSRNRLDETYVKSWRYSITNQISYNKSFGAHNLNAVLVQEALKERADRTAITSDSLELENYPLLYQGNLSATQSINEQSLASYIARVIYDYDNKLYLTASIRRDGSSRFGPNYKWGVFPAVSGAVNLTNFGVAQNTAFSEIKFRAGWGQTGNDNIDNYQYETFLSESTQNYSVFGTSQETTNSFVPLYNMGNPEIKWEASSMTNVGLDLSLWKNKFLLNADFYIKDQDNLIIDRPISAVTGFFTGAAPPVNLGRMRNTGIDLVATYRKMEGEFNFSLALNFSYVKNIVKELYEDVPVFGSIGDENVSQTAIGQSISSWYLPVSDGIFQDSASVANHARQTGAEPGDIRFKDLNYDGQINNSDRTYVGRSLPSYHYGLNFDAWYKGFDLNIFLSGVAGNKIFNEVRRFVALPSNVTDRNDEGKLREVLNYWTEDNPNNDMPRATRYDRNNNGRRSDWWLENGSFLRVSNIQLGYTLPAKITEKVNIGKLRIYISGDNLHVFTKYSGMDPETPLLGYRSGTARSDDDSIGDPLYMGIDAGTYPNLRTFLVGLQVSFKN